jgi:hypothetical protein
MIVLTALAALLSFSPYCVVQLIKFMVLNRCVDANASSCTVLKQAAYTRRAGLSWTQTLLPLRATVFCQNGHPTHLFTAQIEIACVSWLPCVLEPSTFVANA